MKIKHTAFKFILILFLLVFSQSNAIAEGLAITKYEAENAVLTGVSIASSLPGYSGTGYMDGGTFDVETDKITFTVNVATAASYPLVIRFQNTCGACEKAQKISVNGGINTYTTFPGISSSWQDLNVGNVDLKAGNNTITISKSWGWTHIDYIGIGENDVSAPTAPANLKYGDVKQTSFTISWDASTDNIGVTGYDIYFVNTLKTLTTGTTLTITNLNCGAGYPAITVKAKDAAGNISAASNNVSVTAKTCQLFTLTVINGSGNGSYNSGIIIPIAANAAAKNQIFDKWIGSEEVTNPNLSNTTIIMPESATEISATYKDIDPTPLLDPAATPETVALWNYLKSVYGQKMLTGCWTETQFGGNANVVKCSGETPAIWGQDMNSWYRSRTDPYWISTWNSNIQGFKTAHKRGQILQVNWHWQMVSSKVNGAYSRDAWGKDASGNGQMMTSQQWSDIVTPGTDLYNAMIEDIDYHIVNFLKRIVDDKGKPIPIIFRPLHEIDGGWFWWTCPSDPAKTANLFKIMQDRIINFHGVHNLIWVFNPAVVCNNTSWPPFQSSELARRKAYYPGDDFCDITGIDLYDYDPAVRGTYANSGKTYRDAWNMMKAITPSKMIALCESEGLPNPDKCFTDPNYAPWLYCLPWYSDKYTDPTAAATRDLCEWNKVQFKSTYVVNEGDFVITSNQAISVLNKPGFLIYPNPVTNGLLTIKNFDRAHENTVQISILDLTGRMVQQNSFSTGSDEKSIVLQGLKPGVYILECRNGNSRQVEKLIIQ